MTVYRKNYSNIKLPITENLSEEILSLPAMEYVSKSHIFKLSNTIKSFLLKNSGEKK